MKVKKTGKLAVTVMMGVFLLGAAIPAVADTGDENASPYTRSFKEFKLGNAQNFFKGAVKNIDFAGKMQFEKDFQRLGFRGLKNELIEELTGLDTDEIKAELQDGKTMLEIIENTGVSQETLQDKMMEEAQAKLQELLDAGKIDQEKYDECIANLSEKIASRIEFMGMSKEEHITKMQENRERKLQQLFDEGKIDQEKYDKLIDNGFGPDNARYKIAGMKGQGRRILD